MSDVKFIHIRNKVGDKILNNGGTTIAYQGLDPDTVRYAVAHCSPRDNFSKRLGRIKAQGRLDSDKLSVVVSREKLMAQIENFRELQNCLLLT